MFRWVPSRLLACQNPLIHFSFPLYKVCTWHLLRGRLCQLRQVNVRRTREAIGGFRPVCTFAFDFNIVEIQNNTIPDESSTTLAVFKTQNPLPFPPPSFSLYKLATRSGTGLSSIFRTRAENAVYLPPPMPGNAFVGLS